MLKACTIYFALIVAVYASGELSILHSPPGLEFKGHEKIQQSLIKDILSTAIGFTTPESSSWTGMYLKDPFNQPEVLVTFTIDGIDKFSSQGGFKRRSHFPIESNEEMYSTLAAIESRVAQHFPEKKNAVVNIELSEGLKKYQHIFGDLKAKPIKLAENSALKPKKHDEDQDFLTEMAALNGIAEKIQSLDTDSMEAIFFHISALRPVLDLHGPTSSAAKQAFKILEEVIELLDSGLVSMYKGKVLITAITDDNILTRRSRSLMEVREDVNGTAINLAKTYSADYPVIFNILLWFGVAFVFTLIAIAITIGGMDPGRDSIIYRMTSTRIKKDN